MLDPLFGNLIPRQNVKRNIRTRLLPSDLGTLGVEQGAQRMRNHWALKAWRVGQPSTTTMPGDSLHLNGRIKDVVKLTHFLGGFAQKVSLKFRNSRSELKGPMQRQVICFFTLRFRHQPCDRVAYGNSTPRAGTISAHF